MLPTIPWLEVESSWGLEIPQKWLPALNYGRAVEVIWNVLKFWEISEKYLRNIWEIFGNYLCELSREFLVGWYLQNFQTEWGNIRKGHWRDHRKPRDVIICIVLSDRDHIYISRVGNACLVSALKELENRVSNCYKAIIRVDTKYLNISVTNSPDKARQDPHPAPLNNLEFSKNSRSFSDQMTPTVHQWKRKMCNQPIFFSVRWKISECWRQFQSQKHLEVEMMDVSLCLRFVLCVEEAVGEEALPAAQIIIKGIVQQ